MHFLRSRLPLLSLHIASIPNSAQAEVCDKVRPAWTPDHGPVSQLDELLFFIMEPLGLFVLGLMIVAVLIRQPWVAKTSASIVFLVALLLIGEWLHLLDNKQIAQFAEDEGCIAPPILTSTFLLAFALLTLKSSKLRASKCN